MDYRNAKWNRQDYIDLSKQLVSLSKGEEKAQMEQRIVNTALPCLAVPSGEIDNIAKEILRGNPQAFLDNMPHANLSELYVSAKVLNGIKNINEYQKYLLQYINYCDSWGSTDVLRFPLAKKNKDIFLTMAHNFTRSDNPFAIRIGLLILMKCFVQNEYMDTIFDTLDYLADNNHYYVMMMGAWLLCECVIKEPNQTIEYIRNCNLSKFVINKAISKCHDSYRITLETKQLLKTYRR